MGPNLLIYALPISKLIVFNYITIQQQVKHKINSTKFPMAAFCIFIGAMEAIISSRMVLYYHLFLHSLPLNNLLPMIMHESGSQ